MSLFLLKDYLMNEGNKPSKKDSLANGIILISESSHPFLKINELWKQLLVYSINNRFFTNMKYIIKD